MCVPHLVRSFFLALGIFGVRTSDREEGYRGIERNQIEKRGTRIAFCVSKERTKSKKSR